ncbi:MAG TPA: diguanylate cyclase [Thermoanaerobaculales bacterium]|nr:diguanylate cyclase [Thermoanaerobaculales bacterium]HQL30248.1 diguanylate cyclase [Thermoanaerobaculales bacterium]
MSRPSIRCRVLFATVVPVLIAGAAGAAALLWLERVPLAGKAVVAVAIVAAAAVVAGLLALLAARATLGALDELADTVARLGRGELEARYPMRGPGEVDRLGHHINLMADQLEAARSELDREKADLRKRVTGQTRDLQQANRLLMDIANRDVLTGLANRRRLELELERHITLSKRTGVALAVVMIDLDKFKQYNDAAGHLAGDTLLQAVASTLRTRARATDLAVRWGGDEFCILVPGTGPEGALTAAEGFVRAIREAAAELQLPDSDVVVGASAGVACYPGDGEDGTELIARADEALYQVKATGRGRVLRLPRI